MQSHQHHRSRWRHANTPDALRRRRAAQDARNEAMAEALPPLPEPPQAGEVWQTLVIELCVPTAGRCDQHAVRINGERVGLLSASELGRKVRGLVNKRPSVADQADMRREEWMRYDD